MPPKIVTDNGAKCSILGVCCAVLRGEMVVRRKRLLDTAQPSSARGRNRTGMALRPRDFKSLVSTCFTTRAGFAIVRPSRADLRLAVYTPQTLAAEYASRTCCLRGVASFFAIPERARTSQTSRHVFRFSPPKGA